jgi:hypothetical protein
MSLTTAERTARGVAGANHLALIRAFCAPMRLQQRPKRHLRRKIFSRGGSGFAPAVERFSTVDWRDGRRFRMPLSLFEWRGESAQSIGTFAILLFV